MVNVDTVFHIDAPDVVIKIGSTLDEEATEGSHKI